MIRLYDNVPGVHACPDVVRLPDFGFNFGFEGALTFAVGVDVNGDLRLVSSTKLTHGTMLLRWQTRNGRLSNVVEGRVWTDMGVIAIWNDTASEDMEIIEEMLKSELNIDISNYIFVSEFDSTKAFAISVQEFEKIGASNYWNDHLWDSLVALDKKQNGEKQKVSVKNKLGFDDRDYMRHYMYAENIEKIKDSIRESIKEVLKTNFGFEF